MTFKSVKYGAMALVAVVALVLLSARFIAAQQDYGFTGTGHTVLWNVPTLNTPTLNAPTLNAPLLNAPNILQGSASSYNSFTTFPMVLALATYTSVTDISGQQWFSSIFIPTSTTLTGACEMNGSSVATDNVIVALWDSTGVKLASSAAVGALVANNGVFQCQAFTAPVAVTGPARYFVGIQGNGTHATEFLTYVAGSAPTGYATGITAPGTFGTITNITPTTSFTAGQGPIMSVY